MGQSSGDGGSNPYLTATKIGLSGAAGGLNAASGDQQQPVDFGAIGKAVKKFRGGPVSAGDGPNVIPRQGPDVNVPDFNVPQPNPMPDLYGPNGSIPQLKKGVLPFYGY